MELHLFFFIYSYFLYVHFLVVCILSIFDKFLKPRARFTLAAYSICVNKKYIIRVKYNIRIDVSDVFVIIRNMCCFCNITVGFKIEILLYVYLFIFSFIVFTISFKV